MKSLQLSRSNTDRLQWFVLQSISECWIIGGCFCFLVLFSIYFTQKPKWLLISHKSDVYVEMLVLKASSILFFNYYSLQYHWYCKRVYFLLFLAHKKGGFLKCSLFPFLFLNFLLLSLPSSLPLLFPINLTSFGVYHQSFHCYSSHGNEETIHCSSFPLYNE